jgi:hypothetical protein
MIHLNCFFEIARGKPYDAAIVVDHSDKKGSAANQEAWALFSRAVREDCSEKVIRRLERRYDITIDENRKTHLHVKEVLAVEAVLHDIRRKDIPQKSPTRQQLIDKMPEDLPLEKSVYKIRGGASLSSIYQMIVQDPVFMDRKRLQLYSGIEKLKERAYLQRLAMAMISHPLKKGMIIPAPDRKGGRDYYEIKHFAGKKGFKMCALAPIAEDSKLKPIIVLQPTQPSLSKEGIFTVLNDTEYDLGGLGYKASRKVIKMVMNDPLFSKGDVCLTGYSLGGNHAQRLLKDYPKHFRRVVVFNDPHLPGNKIADQYAALVNKKTWKKRCNIDIVLNIFEDEAGKKYEDLTSGFCGTHVGHGVKNPYVKVKVIQLVYKTKNISFKRLHIERLLDCDPKKQHRVKKVVLTGREADRVLDNKQRGIKIGLLEKIRKLVVSHLIHPLLECVWSICQTILNLAVLIFFGEEEDCITN